MMDKISDVTRQDIIDVIRNGFVVSFDEPQYDSISGNYIVSYRAKISSWPTGRAWIFGKAV